MRLPIAYLCLVVIAVLVQASRTAEVRSLSSLLFEPVRAAVALFSCAIEYAFLSRISGAITVGDLSGEEGLEYRQPGMAPHPYVVGAGRSFSVPKGLLSYCIAHLRLAMWSELLAGLTP